MSSSAPNLVPTLPVVMNVSHPEALFNAGLVFSDGLAFVDFFGSMGVYQRQLLISQNAATLADPLFWTKTQTNTGAVVDGNQTFNVSTGTSAAGAAIMESVQRAWVQIGSFNLWSGFVFFVGGAPPPNNCTVTFGITSSQDGVGVQYKNGVLGLVTRTGGVETRVTTFNGEPFSIDYTHPNIWSILYSTGGAIVYFGSTRVHSFLQPIGQSSCWPMRCEVTNTGSVVNTSVQFTGLATFRLGPTAIRPTSVLLNSAGTTVLKHGPGTVSNVVVGTATRNASSVTLYDGLTASGNPKAVLDTSVSQTYPLDLDFYIGLTAVVTVTTTAPSVNLSLQ